MKLVRSNPARGPRTLPDVLLDLAVGSARGEPPEVRSAMLMTLREDAHLTLLTFAWTQTAALAAWYFAGAAWGLAAAAAELVLFPLRLIGSRQVARVERRPHRPAYGVLFASLGAWMLVVVACSYGSVQQADLRVVLIGTMLSCGFTGYVVSRWAAFPRFATAMICMFFLALSLGFAQSPLPGVATIAWLAPAGGVAVFALLRLNHKIIRDALRTQHENKRLSMHDPLTDLPNRLMLRERLSLLCQGLAERPGEGGFAVLCLDLDGFKAVNDRHGHSGGDWLLKLVAGRAHNAVRTEDLVSRTGGDEFVVLLPGAQREEAAEVARRILGAIAEPYDLDTAAQVHVGVSVGIALAPMHGGEADALLTAADDAMYAAKRAGKSCWRMYDAATKVGEQVNKSATT